MDELKQALRQKTGFEPVSEATTATQIRMVGRIPKNKTGQWLRVMERLLVQADSSPWNVDLSKQYFVRGGKLLFGWRIIIQAEQPEQYIEQLVSIIRSTPTVQRQLDEVALHGNVDRSYLRGGKGAQPVFRAVVGPLAALQRRQ